MRLPRALAVVLASLMALLLAGSAMGQGAARRAPAGYPMHAGVSPPFPSIGERVLYRGWVAVGPQDRVDWGSPEGGGDFTWGTPRTGRSPLRLRRRGGPWPADSVWVEVPLQVFALGQISVPGLRFVHQGSGPAHSSRLPIVRLGVPPQRNLQNSAGDLRPARGPLGAPWWEQVPWRWVFGALLLVAAVVLVVRRLRRRKPVAMKAPAPMVAKRRDPAAEALAELAALRRMGLLEQKQFDEHALRLSRILRRYLEATRGALRPGDSTTELLRRLEVGADAGDVNRLAALLRRWDGIKFAREDSNVDEGGRSEEAVRELVVRGARPAREEVA